MIIDSQRNYTGKLALITTAVWLLMRLTVEAHPQPGTIGGFASGFLHPLTGLDHITAMFAVGLWGAYLGAPAIWALPLIFPVVMVFGGVLGVLRVPFPGVEMGIALSSLVLGFMVMTASRPPLWACGIIVGIFALCHGHAHGTELPHAANALTYTLGFILATGLLHLCGIAFGLLTKWETGRAAVRAGGGAIAVVGFGFLVGFL